MMDRRQFLRTGLASPLALTPLAFTARAFAADPIFIADMHAHLFFAGSNTAASKPLARTMAGGQATLVAWSLVGDLLWMEPTQRGYRQKAEPKPGEPFAWFKRELARIKAHLAEQKLKIVRTPQDVDLALKGDPHVVLAVEGASFVEGDLSRLQSAYDLGVRHIQLVHYITNTIGDFQTERPRHDGLTDFGKEVVRECNRLGILVDLAHSTSDAVTQALDISKVPMVWSHSSVTTKRTPNWSMVAWQARQLSIEQAKAIAGKGGVVGLWTLGSDVGATVERYGDRLLEMADWLGEDHVAFGTDMNGLVALAISNYADLRRVVEYWQQRGLSEVRIRKLAIENYARVLRQALNARAG
jgi:membrane dipeptidase